MFKAMFTKLPVDPGSAMALKALLIFINVFVGIVLLTFTIGIAIIKGVVKALFAYFLLVGKFSVAMLPR